MTVSASGFDIYWDSSHDFTYCHIPHFENCKNKSGGYNKDRVSIEFMCGYALFLCTIAH